MTGKIVQISGSIVDVEFESGNLPKINEALTVEIDGSKRVMELAQHIGNNTVRCIMLAECEGLSCDMTVTATGSNIKVPVGTATLGRMFNAVSYTHLTLPTTSRV